MECSRLFRIQQFLLCPSRQRKPQEHSIKSAGDLEKVGNRIVAIASIINCNRKLKTETINFFQANLFLKFHTQLVHFLLIATANSVKLTLPSFPLSAILNVEG